jgi:hypothetical protein
MTKKPRKQKAPTIALRFSIDEVTVMNAYSAATGLTRTRIIKGFVQDQMSMMGSVIINEAKAKKEDGEDPGEWTSTLPDWPKKEEQNSVPAPERS